MPIYLQSSPFYSILKNTDKMPTQLQWAGIRHNTLHIIEQGAKCNLKPKWKAWTHPCYTISQGNLHSCGCPSPAFVVGCIQAISWYCLVIVNSEVYNPFNINTGRFISCPPRHTLQLFLLACTLYTEVRARRRNQNVWLGSKCYTPSILSICSIWGETEQWCFNTQATAKVYCCFGQWANVFGGCFLR